MALDWVTTEKSSSTMYMMYSKQAEDYSQYSFCKSEFIVIFARTGKETASHILNVSEPLNQVLIYT